jgi:acetylornithine deacetylase
MVLQDNTGRFHAELNPTIEVLQKLVGFNTVSAFDNQPLIDWAANYLEHQGLRIFSQPGDEPGKANLIASTGPLDQPGILLSGHSDTVPVAGEVWTTDPFALSERNGNLYGRGSADMKGFIACCMGMAKTFAQPGLKTPVHIALSYNEETNMHGMKVLAQHLASLPVKPLGCVIGEPTTMQVVVANKGAAIWHVKVKGKGVHSSLRDQGVSAVEIAAEIIVFINALQKKLDTEQRHDGFEYPFTSVHVGKIQGGTAHNITAVDCDFVFEVRALPGVRAAAIAAQIKHYCDHCLLPGMKAISPECNIEVLEIVDAPGLDDRVNPYLAQRIMPLCGCLAPARVSFGTEAGMLQDIGVPTVVCGPGQIRVAHQPDEFVEIEQLSQCLHFLQALNTQLRVAPFTL